MTDTLLLSESIARYADRVRAVNQRCVRYFIAELRGPESEFRPRVALDVNDDDFDPENLPAEGYTYEGGLSRYAHEHALLYPDLEMSANPTPAERLGQVYHRPAENLINALPGPTRPPPSPENLRDTIKGLITGLQQQARAMPYLDGTIPIPEELIALLRLTDGINGAGFPSYTGNWFVLWPHHMQSAHSHDVQELRKILERQKKSDVEVIAAIHIGGNTHLIEVWYGYCRGIDDENSEYEWKIFEENGGMLLVFATMLEYMNSKIALLEMNLADHPEGKGIFLNGITM